MKAAQIFLGLCVLLTLLAPTDAEARRRKKRAYSGPPVTHPIVLWAKTLEESTDVEQRKVAAYKLANYTQPIFKESIIDTLLKCSNDPELNIKVLCVKALAKAKKVVYENKIRTTLLALFDTDKNLRNTIVRVFTEREDASPTVSKKLLGALAQAADNNELIALLGYLELYGPSGDAMIPDLLTIYRKTTNTRVKTSVAKVLTERTNGQSAAIELLAECASGNDTPLQLTCLAGLETHGKRDSRAWGAITSAMKSSDPDVLLAAIDVINALPPTPQPQLTTRLLEICKSGEDNELREKAILALAVCGDEGQTLVNDLHAVLSDEESPEQIRVAAALVLGEQAGLYPDVPMTELNDCQKNSSSHTLRTACQVGHKDLVKRSALLAGKRKEMVLKKPEKEREVATEEKGEKPATP